MKIINKSKKFKTLSIVIPVYNEENTISSIIKQAVDEKVKEFYRKEIIVVDDGSTDKTKAILKRLNRKYKTVKIISKKNNQGKGSALKAGISVTTGDVVIVQDADMEYSPAEYNNLLEPFIKYDADVVYGSRFSIYKARRIMYYWHSIMNNFLTGLSNILTNLNLSDMETGFKCFRGDLIRKMAPKIKSKRFGFEPEITAKISKIKGLKIYEIGISYHGRRYEEGKKITWKDGIKAVWEILRFNLFD